jgi:hypothetical protein
VFENHEVFPILGDVGHADGGSDYRSSKRVLGWFGWGLIRRFDWGVVGRLECVSGQSRWWLPVALEGPSPRRVVGRLVRRGIGFLRWFGSGFLMGFLRRFQRRFGRCQRRFVRR